MLKDGPKTVASFVPKTAKSQRGPATLHAVTASGHALLEARIPLLGDGPKREEVWIAGRSAGGVTVIAWSLAGARDADGETSLVLRVSDRGIEEYQTAARLSRCDGATVPLFRRVCDFATRSFRAAPPSFRRARAPRCRRADGGAPEGPWAVSSSTRPPVLPEGNAMPPG